MSSSLAREDTDCSFESLYRRHRGDVYRFVLRDLRNPADAEDVTQTAFLNAYRALQNGDPPEKPRAWLLTIAQNVSRRRFRARASRPQEVELDPDLFVAPEAEGLSAGEIREALARLRPNHRAVIVLREIGGLSYAEIAETLKLSVSAVETLLFRARRALREELTAGDERRVLRLGGFVLPLPALASNPFGSLAGWFGRRLATAQVAGAVGATVIGVGVAVQTGVLAVPGSQDRAVPAQPSGAVLAPDVSDARVDVRSERDRQAERGARGRAGKGSEGGKAGSGRSVLGVEVPAVSLPAVEVGPVSVPNIGVPDVDVPPPPDVPLVEIEPPPLPDADELLP